MDKRVDVLEIKKVENFKGELAGEFAKIWIATDRSGGLFETRNLELKNTKEGVESDFTKTVWKSIGLEAYNKVRGELRLIETNYISHADVKFELAGTGKGLLLIDFNGHECTVEQIGEELEAVARGRGVSIDDLCDAKRYDIRLRDGGNNIKGVWFTALKDRAGEVRLYDLDERQLHNAKMEFEQKRLPKKRIGGVKM